MKPTAIYILLVGLLMPLWAGDAARAEMVLYDMHTSDTIPLSDLSASYPDHRIILVGEHHTNAGHHRAQLAVIQSLVAAGRKVAVGMEMFRSDSQSSLDAWVAGQLEPDAFEAVYLDNWNYPWPLYQPILAYAREQRLPVVGLNVPRNVTRQVAYQGFDSLSEKDRQDLPFVTCDVDADYMAFIRQAYGAHGHGQMDFTHFCEAQLVWDKAMAARSLRFLEANPEHTIVLLTGSGHARKGGIPAQIQKMGPADHLVILPEVPGGIDRTTIDKDDADLLISGY
ncbi:MAG: ChaN family lipoprotein [Desulfobacterales bacterium]|nr:ChaN family lipoprotein [Desulfobacterales bacterium]MDJ0887736.1 ChaN family lipoprotein [Desulfobacterales bacterium]MDJ0989357.1 ChaN family lipoprotein [Desulfobacterales bacterium]